MTLGKTLDDVLAGRSQPLSWRTMLGGRAPDTRELRRFVLARPVLDYRALKPGERATTLIRDTAAALKLDPAHGVRVRLTGNVPMSDEEFGTLEENATVNAVAALGALLSMLWLAVRSLRATVAIVLCLVAGLAVTAACGLAIFGAFNLISVAFAVLFVGLGVDFGIQYAVAYRAVAHLEADRVAACARASRDVGGSLALAAAGIALGFLAFVPTDYRGVSELGVVAAIGMAIAFAASITLLPALLRLLGVGGQPEGLGFRALAPVDDALAAHRRRFLLGGAVVAALGLAALPFVRFDFDPIHLRSDRTEAVSTLLDLAKDPRTTPDTIDVLAPSLAAARSLGAKLSALPEVQQALTLASFVPQDQAPKLASIDDAASLLDPTLNPASVKPTPTDAEDAAALRTAADALRRVGDDADAVRVARGFDALAAGPSARRDALRDALVPGLAVTLAQARDSLRAQAVTIETLPASLRADWIARDGRARVEVFPRIAGHGSDDAAIARFIAAVRTVAPDASGTPISIQESARTIIRAFVVAGVLALVSVALLLAVVLRRAREVAITLASLTLGGLATLALCVAFGIPLNYANVIALPLLFGIGVAFNIYFVVAWRRGVDRLLETSLARAVVFSALTTSTAFGSLWLSSHPGTASMGKLLAISLACTLAAALLVLPALLGPAPRDAA